MTMEGCVITLIKLGGMMSLLIIGFRKGILTALNTT